MKEFDPLSPPQDPLGNLQRLGTLELAALEMIGYKLDRLADLLKQSNKLQERVLSLVQGALPGR